MYTRHENNTSLFPIVWPPHVGCRDEVTQMCHPSHTPGPVLAQDHAT